MQPQFVDFLKKVRCKHYRVLIRQIKGFESRSLEIIDALHYLLKEDPKERMTIKILRSHPFM